MSFASILGEIFCNKNIPMIAKIGVKNMQIKSHSNGLRCLLLATHMGK